MQIPEKPPPDDIAQLLKHDASKLFRAVTGATIQGRYLHWSKLKYQEPPEGLSHVDWWALIKFQRKLLYTQVPLIDPEGKPFRFLVSDPIPERLHKLDQGAGGMIQVPEQLTNRETRDQYHVSSLIEEAITSSQLEGAATTRLVAKEMLRIGREPHDRSERMILNNYLTMQKLGQLKSEPLSKELVFRIHRIVTHESLDDPSAAGRFRRADESVYVGDDYGTIYHTPPPAEELEDRMAAMCAFANGETPEFFIHPAIRAIILHFWLAYDHPFKDGNGRTARTLFYWSMLRHGFWLCEYISISQIILRAPMRYQRAFLYTKTDDNDLTYFILYHLDVMKRAVEQLHEYIKRKTEQLRSLEARLRGLHELNHRQRALISHALRHPNQTYTIESHRTSHDVVYETARSDLHDLERRKLLLRRKISKTWYFSPARDLEYRLSNRPQAEVSPTIASDAAE